MAGFLDIQSVFPEIAMKAAQDRQTERMTGWAGLENLAQKSQQRLSAGLRGGLAQATGNTGLLTGDQNFMRAVQAYDPQKEDADLTLLEAAKQYAPQRVPALLSAMEKKRQQAFQEDLASQQNQRANDANARDARRFGLEEQKWTNFKEQQDIENGFARERMANEQRRMGQTDQQISISERNLDLGVQRNAREIRQFAVENADRLSDGDAREAMAKTLEAQGLDLLAEGMRAPGSNMNSILSEAAAIQRAKIAENIKGLELAQGNPPSEATTDSFVNGTIDKLSTESGTGFFNFEKNEENAPEVAFLLRIWYQGGGYMAINANPVAGRQAALEFVKQNSGYFNEEDRDVGTGSTPIGTGVAVPNVNNTLTGRPALSSYEG